MRWALPKPGVYLCFNDYGQAQAGGMLVAGAALGSVVLMARGEENENETSALSLSRVSNVFVSICESHGYVGDSLRHLPSLGVGICLHALHHSQEFQWCFLCRSALCL